MKKIFTLIAAAFMAVGANAETTTPVIYNLDNQAATYKLGDNCEATTYTLDGVEGFSVNYTGASSAKMQVKLAANNDIFFEYSNSKAKSNAVKTAATYFQCDSKNFIITVPLQTDDILYIKFSGKNDNGCTLAADGACADNLTAVEGYNASSTGKADIVTYAVKASKGVTAKIKEGAQGMRVYSIAINDASIATGISEVSASAAKAVKAKKVVKNGRLVIETAAGEFSVSGARVK